jgi:hypothetical protein
MDMSEIATQKLWKVRATINKVVTDSTSVKTRGVKDNNIKVWLNNIQNLLRPNLLSVNASTNGPRRNLIVQGSKVMESSKEMSETEAPLETRYVVKPMVNPPESP